MLEHVSEEVGAQYLDAILSFSSITEKEIIEFCAKNDVLGDPAKYVYDNMCVSPTSLRYIFQAHLILTHMKATNQSNFSEISKENQESYIQKLFPKIVHGFIAWNMIPVYDFGFTTRVEHEFPNTGSGPKDTLNKYVYF